MQIFRSKFQTYDSCHAMVRAMVFPTWLLQRTPWQCSEWYLLGQLAVRVSRDCKARRSCANRFQTLCACRSLSAWVCTSISCRLFSRAGRCNQVTAKFLIGDCWSVVWSRHQNCYNRPMEICSVFYLSHCLEQLPVVFYFFSPFSVFSHFSSFSFSLFFFLFVSHI